MSKNIILVTVDCLRNDFYSPGNSDLRFLNFLASNSTYYPNCYNLADNTMSSIPQLLTSTYLNLIPFKESKKGELNVICQIKEPRISIAQTLRDNDYNTYAFQTAPHLVPSFGYDKGFNSYTNFNPFISGSIPVLDELYKYPFTKAEKINEYILSKRFKEPYFLWIHYCDVHDPYVSSTFPLPLSNFLWHHFYKKKSVKDNNGKILFPQVSNQFKNHFKKLYAKKVKYIDDNLYDLFINNEKFNLEDSHFILTSDHGQALGEFNQIGHGYRLIPSPQVANIPLYVISGSDKGSNIDNKRCTLLDVAPTITDLVKIDKLEIYDGSSLFDDSYEESPIVWSNTVDFNNSIFSIKIIKDNLVFWRDDNNFQSPQIYRFGKDEIHTMSDSLIEKEFSEISSNHINYLKNKQEKYINTQEILSTQDQLDPEVFNALKALRYV